MTRGALVVALLLALPAGAKAPDVETVLDTLGFPDDTEAKVRADQFVDVALPTRSDRDLHGFLSVPEGTLVVYTNHTSTARGVGPVIVSRLGSA